MMTMAIMLIATYLIGSVNFSIVLLGLLGKGDPREHFSGNAGTTNVYRQAGPGWAAAVLLLELSRSAGVALLGLCVLPLPQAGWLAVALVLGSIFPLFHGLRGGKGVASFLGFTAGFAPIWALSACAAWVAIYAIAKKPFLASLGMIAVLASGHSSVEPLDGTLVVSALCVVVLVVFAHRTNLRGWRRAPL